MGCCSSRHGYSNEAEEIANPDLNIPVFF